jgi:hypothetical protein
MLTASEITAELYNSANTMKAHTRSIYMASGTPATIYVVVEHCDDGQPMDGQRCGRRTVASAGVQWR